MKLKKQTSIFIVEDNAAQALALKANIETSFSNMFLQVEIFTDGGLEFKKRFLEVKPRIIILDYYLNSINPDADDGIKVLKWIKNENSKTDVIMLTREEDLDLDPSYEKSSKVHVYLVKSKTNKPLIFSLDNLFKKIESEEKTRLGVKLLTISWILFIGFLIFILKCT
jgi:CheY-like chemotaxis protein